MKIFFSLFLCLSCLFLARYSLTGQAVYGDGIFYYSYARSIVKDRDLNFANELGHHWSPQNNNGLIEDTPDIVSQRTRTNLVPNKYPIGAPFSWLPVLALTDLTLGGNGYSDAYQIAVGLFNVGLVALGITWLIKFWRQFFPKTSVYLGVGTTLLASNLIYYGAFDVINSHPLSFLLSVMLLIFWWKYHQSKNSRSWLYLGIIIGALALTRTQDLILLLMIGFESLVRLGKHQIKNVLVMFFGTIITFIPQLLILNHLYGQFLSPYLTRDEGFSFFKPHLLGVLFNNQTGLLLWTPVYLLAVWGVIKYLPKQPILMRMALLIFLAQLYLIASWSGWTQGESFGVRMLIGTLPFLAGGLIYLFQKRLSFLIALLLISYNVLSIGYFQLIKQNPTLDRGTVTQSERLQRLFKN